METTDKKIEFDILKVLTIIEGNASISNIFRDEVSLEYPLLRSMAIKGLLNGATHQLIHDIYEKIVLLSPDVLTAYMSIESEGIPSITPSVAPSVTPSKKVKKLPRRYGKRLIMKDIKDSGGKATEAQLAGLRINELKNIYINLEARIIKTLLSDTKVLNDDDCRVIKATIDTVKKKLDYILQKK